MGKNLIKKSLFHILKVLILTFLILYSYSYIEKHALIQHVQKWLYDTANEYLTPRDQNTDADPLSEFKVLFKTSISKNHAVNILQAKSKAKDSVRSLEIPFVKLLPFKPKAAGSNESMGTKAQKSNNGGADSAAKGSRDSSESVQNSQTSTQSADPSTETVHSSLNYRAVWLSYIEFMEYLESVEENTEQNFRAFYNRVVDKAMEAGMNTMIVQVRPFGDALYPSKYFPWSFCISGVQGKNPGYDPLKIMVEITHKKGLSIEAWINPYRVLSSTDTSVLAARNPALIWMKSKDKKVRGRILTFDGALYYNPSRAMVRNLITEGVREIINNYQVDGIHMDDYFYPDFEPEQAVNSFDIKDYRNYSSYSSCKYKPYHSGKHTLSEWRRNNVNMLVSQIYRTIKAKNPKLTFGISPNGNLEDLRSNYQYYTDIDRWITESGYVDYLTPQLYWGYFNEYAPYQQLLKQWAALMKDSSVKLYIGLPLYRMATSDPESKDNFEFFHARLFFYMLEDIKKTARVDGITLFSYEYLDPDSKWYNYESTTYEEYQKKILREVFQIIKDMDWSAG